MRGTRAFLVIGLFSWALAGCDDPLMPADVELAILSPGPGESVLAGDTVLLAAAATLPAGRTADLTVSWSTSRDGVLGTGDSIEVVFGDSGVRVIEATVDLGKQGARTERVTLGVLFNGAAVLDSVSVPPAMFDRDTVPLVAHASDAESEARVAWLDGDLVLGTAASGDTVWWTPGGAAGARTIVARAVDAQGFASDSAVSVNVLDGGRIRWTASGAVRGYRDFLSDWGAITAVGPTGDIAVGFYHGQPCHQCLWVFSADGALRWQRELDGPLGDHSAGLTFASDGSLYAMVFFGWLYRFAADGTPLWSRKGVGNDPHGRFALDPNGALLVAANDSSGAALARLDPTTGADVWRIRSGGTAYSAGPTVLADGSVAAQLGTVLVRTDSEGALLADTVPTSAAHYMSAGDGRAMHYLAARSNANGLVAVGPDHTVEWSVPTTPDPPVAEPVIDADTTAYVATRRVTTSVSTTVLAVAHDGTIRWTRVVSGTSEIPRLALLADGSLLVAAGTDLHRLDRGSGTVVESLTFPARVQSALAVAGDGTVYVVIGDGRLLALNGWGPLDPDAPWPIWRRDNRRTASVPRP